MSGQASPPLAGISIVITRPVGAGTALARRARADGAQVLHLPGLSLQASTDPGAGAALRRALAGDVVVFSSPAAVRFAARLEPLRPAGRCRVCAMGHGTAAALHRHGIDEVVVPSMRSDSEGLLAHPALAATSIRGRHVALVGAPGGRGLLERTLRARGAHVSHVNVYRRRAARLDRRHHDRLRALRGRCCVLLSSAEALANLQQALPAPLWQRLTRCLAVASSARLRDAARAAGFRRVVVANSAAADDLLVAVHRARDTRAQWHPLSEKD